DLAHFAQGTHVGAASASMEPYLLMNQRYGFTSLDYAVLADIGWSISPPLTASPPITVPPTVPPAAGGTSGGTAPVVALSSDPFTLSGTADGLVSTYQFQTTAEQIITKDPIQPCN